MVFAADSRYYRFLLPIIEQVRKGTHGKSYRILVYSLGMSPQQIHALRCRVPDLADEVRVPSCGCGLSSRVRKGGEERPHYDTQRAFGVLHHQRHLASLP